MCTRTHAHRAALSVLAVLAVLAVATPVRAVFSATTATVDQQVGTADLTVVTRLVSCAGSSL